MLAVKSAEALELIKKLTYNTVVQPQEERFRKASSRAGEWAAQMRGHSTRHTRTGSARGLPTLPDASLSPLHAQVRLSNPKIQQTLGLSSHAVDALVALGWAQEEVDGEPCLVVPSGRYLKMEQVG